MCFPYPLDCNWIIVIHPIINITDHCFIFAISYQCAVFMISLSIAVYSYHMYILQWGAATRENHDIVADKKGLLMAKSRNYTYWQVIACWQMFDGQSTWGPLLQATTRNHRYVSNTSTISDESRSFCRSTFVEARRIGNIDMHSIDWDHGASVASSRLIGSDWNKLETDICIVM
jgi:hypothetical protein